MIALPWRDPALLPREDAAAPMPSATRRRPSEALAPARHLAARSRPLAVDPELARLLREVDLFDDLDPVELEELAERLVRVELAAGSWLLRQGDAGESCYILAVGRLRVTRRDEGEGEEHFLRELGPGEVVGEMALLTTRARSASVQAVRDCELLRLDDDAFAELVERHPKVLRRIAHLLVERLVSAVAVPESTRAVTVVVAPAGAEGSTHARLAAELGAALARSGGVALLDAAAIDAALGAGGSSRAPGSAGWGEVATLLARVERAHDYVVFATDDRPSEWTRTCLRQADLVVLVGELGTDACLGPVEQVLDDVAPAARRELVLHHASEVADAAVAPWLSLRMLAEHHHWRAEQPRDLERLARTVRGRACAVVLSGGGPRGFAHLGVLRAFDEVGIPCDYVAGTSIGAVMGALAAMDLDHATRLEMVAELGSRRGVIDPTLPVVALANGRRVNRVLQAAFGELRIEDLVRSFVCCSADLVTAEARVHDTGVLWRALRASLSLPGIFPPVPDGDSLLVDGATLDNLPIGAMRRRMPVGLLVAVDLFPGIGPYGRAPSDPSLSGWHEFARRLRHRREPSDPALGIFDVLSRANALAGVRWQRGAAARHAVDLHLRPPLPVIGAFDFRAARPFVEIGYRHTLEMLEATGFAAHFASR